MDCLQSHQELVAERLPDIQEQAQIPASQLVVEAVMAFVEDQKKALKEVDMDIKDARRRISASKGPSGKKKGKHAAQEASASESGEESAASDADP